MLTKLSLLLAVSTVVLSASAASADNYHRHHHRYHDRGGVTLDFGNIAFGYNDGYWDTGHRWHRWSNNGHRDGYRNYQGNNYHGWRHNRDRDNGWRDR